MRTALDSKMRYREYLGRFGIAEPDDRIAELRDLDVGSTRFFAYAEGGGLRLKAAVTPNGVVTAGKHADDDWYGLLSAADASVVADRVAWLQTDESASYHGLRAQPVCALAPDRRPAAIDPAEWALVTAAALLAGSGDSMILVAWFLPSGSRALERWTVTARNGEATAIVVTSASELLAAAAGSAKTAAAESNTRALSLLRVGTDDERLWAMRYIGEVCDDRGVPAIVELLANEGAGADVRLLAAATLGHLGDESAVDALGATLRADAAPEVRRACAQALSSFHDAHAVRVLADAALTEPDMAVRAEIVHALATQGIAARPALAKIADADASTAIRELARASLGSIQTDDS